MASRIWEIAVTVPINTLQSAPQVTKWITEDNLVNSIELTVPPGHNGLTGIRIMKGDVQLLPYSANSFIVANDYTKEFLVNDYVPTADVSIQTYNTGGYPHTFYLRATLSDYPREGGTFIGSPSAALPVGTITESPDPLSPDAILGPATTDQLQTGLITADDLAQTDVGSITVATGIELG